MLLCIHLPCAVSLVCRPERVNLWLLQIRFSFFLWRQMCIIFTQHQMPGEETSFGYGLAERGPGTHEPFNLRAVTTRQVDA